jgi:methionyl-tRNA formyltransferase
MSASNPTIVLATPHRRHDALESSLQERGLAVVRIRDRAALNFDSLTAIGPSFVFLPHWSWRIPERVFTNFECIVFHMTDLPFGRGGSPLQNLIVRGIYETKLTALRCEAGLDTGPVYLQRPLSLHGAAEEIFLRAANEIETMIVEIVEKRPTPQAQTGPATTFQRRRPQDGDIALLASLGQVHDHIRMLDADGYPPAFVEAGTFRLEFSRSKLGVDGVIADVRITMKKEPT